MAHFDTIKAAIDAKVNTNGRQAITGHILNDVLHRMLDAVDVALADEVRRILGDVPVEYDTLAEIAQYIATDKKQYQDILSALKTINEALRTKVNEETFSAAIEILNQSISSKLDKKVHDSFVADMDRALSLKVDTLTYDTAISNINSLFSALTLTIDSLSKQVNRLNNRVTELEGNKIGNLIGTAKVGYSLVG